MEALPQSWQAKEAQEQKKNSDPCPKHFRPHKTWQAAKRRTQPQKGDESYAERFDARYDDSPEVRALPPSLLTEWRANREALEGQNQLKVPNRLQNGLSSIQRTGLWFFCRHAERFAAQRRWVAGPRRRRCLAITTGRLRIRPSSNAPSSGCIGEAGPCGTPFPCPGGGSLALQAPQHNVSQMCTTIALALRTCCLNRSGLRPWPTCCELNI